MHRLVATAVFLGMCVSTAVAEVVFMEDFQSPREYRQRWGEHLRWRLVQAEIRGGGGVGQAPDYWVNDYFDDTYCRNAPPEKQQGYCTDVWFDEAWKFMTAKRNHPSFAYISTNAPHSPSIAHGPGL